MLISGLMKLLVFATMATYTSAGHHGLSGVHMRLQNFARYIDYEGDLITADINATFFKSAMHMEYNLWGVEPACSEPSLDIANSCGIHIHVGVSCAEGTGGHYIVEDTDPWKYVNYTSTGTTAQGRVTVNYLDDDANVRGRALVIHNYAGKRVMCQQVLPSIEAISNQFDVYPGYEGKLDKVEGKVHWSFLEDEVGLVWDLEGLDKNCDQGRDADIENSCGIHIHVGSTCEDANEIGGHFFQTPDGSDPWQDTHYVTLDDRTGTSIGRAMIPHGYPYNMTEGRVAVIHDFNGVRIACSHFTRLDLVSPTVRLLPLPTQYPGSRANNITAEIDFMFFGEKGQAFISYDLSNLEAECANFDPDTPNSCGIHIHQRGCEDALFTGGHYWQPETVPDPWIPVTYSPDFKEGHSKGFVVVDVGAKFEECSGRAFVVHAYDGARMQCMTIPEQMVERTKTNDPDPDPEPSAATSAVASGAFVAVLLASLM